MWTTKMMTIGLALLVSTSVLGSGRSESGPATVIPDGQSDGVTLGPIQLPAGDRMIDQVLLGLDICHPHTGDLQLELLYDSDNDGTCDARAEVELYLARSDAHTDPLFACPAAIDGRYYFKDEDCSAARTSDEVNAGVTATGA